MPTYTGTAGADSLTGSSSADVMNGLDGNDTLNGGAGADTLDGGNGDDVLYVDSNSDRISDNVGANEVRSFASYFSLWDQGAFPRIATLTYVGSGNFHGIGQIGDERITGGSGDDTINGNIGLDTLDGGAGFDMLDISSVYQGGWPNMNVNLAAGTAYAVAGTGEGNDVIMGFEGVIGSSMGDTLTGDSNANLFQGNEGDDVLAGALGADTLDGGGGFDTVTFAQSNAAVTVTLGATGSGGHAQGDVYTNVEDWIGSAYNDWITTGNTHDRISGGVGSDTLHGGQGNDTLDGGSGPDTVRGGQGADSIVGGTGDDWLSGDLGNDTIRLDEVPSAGADTLHAAANHGTDTIIGFDYGSGDRIVLDDDLLGSVSLVQIGTSLEVRYTGGKFVLGNVTLGADVPTDTSSWIFYVPE